VYRWQPQPNFHSTYFPGGVSHAIPLPLFTKCLGLRTCNPFYELLYSLCSFYLSQFSQVNCNRRLRFTSVCLVSSLIYLFCLHTCISAHARLREVCCVLSDRLLQATHITCLSCYICRLITFSHLCVIVLPGSITHSQTFRYVSVFSHTCYQRWCTL
jgi:hypothetical protein